MADKCVWTFKRHISGNYYETECKWRIPHFMRQTSWKYCPYCGKEIEEVK